MGSALQRLTALLLLSGAAALRLPHVQAPSGPLKASRRGGAFVHMNLVLTEENVESVLAECQAELGTLFGSNDQSLKVGITGVRRGPLQPTHHPCISVPLEACTSPCALAPAGGRVCGAGRPLRHCATDGPILA